MNHESIVNLAVEQALAALPDVGFAEKFNIKPEFINELKHSISHWSAEGSNPFSGLSGDELLQKKCELLTACVTVMFDRAWPEGGKPLETITMINDALEQSGVKLDGVLAYDIEWYMANILEEEGEGYNPKLSAVMMIPRDWLIEYLDQNDDHENPDLEELANMFGAEYLSDKSSFLVDGFRSLVYTSPMNEIISEQSL